MTLHDEIGKITAEVQTDADTLKNEIEDYAAHLVGGGDAMLWPAKFTSEIRQYAMRINNAHRMSVGLLPVPVSPLKGGYAYRLMVHMMEREGEWIAYRVLKPIAGGGRVQDCLGTALRVSSRDARLGDASADSEWLLERRDGSYGVEYRLVRATKPAAVAS